MTKLFHIKIQVKKTKVDAKIDFGSQSNLVVVDLVNKLVCEFIIILTHIHQDG